MVQKATMNEIQLNLTRKWRAGQFDQIIGQDLVVRMLKNSLYLDRFFPVYLLSGNRGCGKTSTARVFAAALNCERLADFQRNPKEVCVPCLECASCNAMRAGKHPDFFEIDAASHTGVDMIRSVIDSSSFMPLLGRKKIYLVDEAHMLSKAAFNALLKILEEPPQGVLFMLATTDPQKIIDTVKSRCFQLLFKPVEQETLAQYLSLICERENIPFDKHGLMFICKETDGCVRDAINLLEQVRFAGDAVTKDAVLTVLGYLDDERLMRLFELVLYQGPERVVHFLHEIQFSLFAVDRVFEQLLVLIRDAMWAKHGVVPPHGADRFQALKELVGKCSWQRLHEIGQYFYEHEQQFWRTTQKHALLEVMLLQLCKKNNANSMSGTPAPAQAVMQSAGETISVVDENSETDDEEDPADEQEQAPGFLEVRSAIDDRWAVFLERVASLGDPLVLSIFKQGRFVGFDAVSARVTLAFSKEFLFFQDWLADTKSLWQKPMQEVFTENVTCVPQFLDNEKLPESAVQAVVVPRPKVIMPERSSSSHGQSQHQDGNRQAPRAFNSFARQKTMPARGPLEERVDVSDTQRWATATMLLNYFPGTITKVQDKVV